MRLVSLDLVHCSPAELAMADVPTTEDLEFAASHTDVILTDGPGAHAGALAEYRITADVLAKAPAGVRLAPCPPFIRGREVTADAIAGPAFVGYEFKRALAPVQQAILAHCIV
ncbi:ornithine carbamoyltransferase [Microbacterium sp. ZKA21]|uniref:hypothetical protein n=1 Tax=Microbacterium sp. ZKA21 TaxID=3381694 RepID=UPI003D1CB627